MIHPHFESPAEFGLGSPGSYQVIGHDELLEVKISIAILVNGPGGRLSCKYAHIIQGMAMFIDVWLAGNSKQVQTNIISLNSGLIGPE